MLVCNEETKYKNYTIKYFKFVADYTTTYKQRYNSKMKKENIKICGKNRHNTDSIFCSN